MLLWGGGIWDWLDAPTVIRATARLPDDVHLVFQGVKRPALLERDEHAAGARGDRARARARARGRVHFNHDWVPYEQRGAWLLEADLGVSAHPAHLETRFAYRTRIADYLWAGLPVVTSAGRRARRPRRGARPRPRGRRRATTRRSPPPAPSCSRIPAPPASRVAAAADELRWDRVVEPLLDFCRSGAKRAHESTQGARHPQRHPRPICTDRHGDPRHRRPRHARAQARDERAAASREAHA